MRLPPLEEIPSVRRVVNAFRGYNHNRVIGEDEFYEMENMTADEYPMLAPRKPRRKLRAFTKPHGLLAHEKLCWVDGTGFYYDGVNKGTVADSDKQLVSMGTSVVIWPDKKRYNAKTNMIDSLFASTTTEVVYPAWEGGDLIQMQVPHGMFKKNDRVLLKYTVFHPGHQEPDDWWTEDKEKWMTIKSIQEFTPKDDIEFPYDKEFMDEYYDGYDMGYESILLQRKIPDMDYICELNNRLWGCSSATNELFCSKQGDPFNWFVFNNDAQDSWAVNVGTPGPFTGICAYRDSVLFFKEDCIHRVYGTRPQNFQVSTTACLGVEAGSSRSIQVLGERVFYKSRRGICLYAGSLPTLISEAFGETVYTGAAAGAYGDKYYVSMKALRDPADRDWDGEHSELLVYDAAKGLWHKEGREAASSFAAYDGELLFIGEDKGLYAVGGGAEDPPSSGRELCVPWMAQTGRLLAVSPDNKHVSKIQVKVSLDEGATLRVEIRYDGFGPWRAAAQKISTTRAGYTIPVIPRRCDSFELRLSGTGEIRILALAFTMEQGSEI